MSDMVPRDYDDKPNIVPRDIKPKFERWNHPDPRLAHIISNAVQLGLSASKVASIAKIDMRTLKEYYSSELENGKIYVSMQLLDVANELALSGDQKMLQYMMKNWVEPLRDNISNPEQDKQDMSKGELNLEQLTKDELKLFMKLMNKAKPIIEAE